MEDGSAALCPRADGVGSLGKYGEYGYLYVFGNGAHSEAVALPPVVKDAGRTAYQLDAIWRPRVRLWSEQGQVEVGRLAGILGVGTESLRQLDAGWDGKAWTFPERDHSGLIVGVARRFPDGTKRSAVGSRRGLTYTDCWRELDGPILIVEGASDVAAGTTIGLATIGRPSNIGGCVALAGLLKGCRRRVILVAEQDQKDDRWPGLQGCRAVAAKLRRELGFSAKVAFLSDGSKDLRVWLNSRKIDVGSTSACRQARLDLLGALGF